MAEMETSVRVKPSISKSSSSLGRGPLARRVVCIVPAYNESGRIGKVLAGLRQVERLDAILVVDDGSLDGTLNEARTAAQDDPRVRVLHHGGNRGKGSAVLSGLSAAGAFKDEDWIDKIVGCKCVLTHQAPRKIVAAHTSHPRPGEYTFWSHRFCLEQIFNIA